MIDAMRPPQHPARPRAEGVETGLLELDSLIGGFRPGQMIVLAARPSMGKTLLAVEIASHVPRQGSGALLISLKMSEVELEERFPSVLSGLNISRIHQSHLTSNDNTRPLGSPVTPPEFPLWIDDSPSQSATQIVATARQLKAQHDIGLVVIDYLQLVTSEDTASPRKEQVAATSRRLKSLAEEINAPVLVLSQLNRDCEDRPDKRPMLSDLPQSGQIEANADVVLLMHRPDYYDLTDRPGIAELIVAKNRNGATTEVDLAFDRELMRFSDFRHGIDL